MRTDFTTGFNAEKNKAANAPINLLKIDWPGINGFPAKTVRLADRPVSIDGTDWLALIEDWGELAVTLDHNLFQETGATIQCRIRLLNDAVDFGSGAERFSELFQNYPPEAADVTLYQWFDGAALGAADMAELFSAKITDPIEFDEGVCSFGLALISSHHGYTIVGTLITAQEFPNAPGKSIARAKPIVIGKVEEAPGISVRKVLKTHLTSVILPGAATLDVTSTDGFPTAGNLVVNDDEISYTAKTQTQFTGCAGINEFHYGGDEAIEKVNDHRYLFSDPAYPVKSISNVKVAGELAPVSNYQIDVANAEVIFTSKPRRVRSLDTKFLQAQFDAVAGGNNAIDPLNAADPDGKTKYARVNQTNSVLALKQIDSLPSIGQIGKVLLRVEHFVEEKLPNDSITADIEGLGQVGTLSNPAPDDLALAAGTTDITHNHLDTLGFPVNVPNHNHVANTEAEKITFQGASSGLGSNQLLNWSGNAGGPYAITISFPSVPAGVTRAEYELSVRCFNQSFSQSQCGTPALNFLGRQIAAMVGGTIDWSYATRFTVNGGSHPTSANITVTCGSVRVDVLSVKRILFSDPNASTDPKNLDTVKGGAVTQHGSSPNFSATTEKSTSTVIDHFDITTLVNGDWSWFLDKVVKVQYNGTSDGRTAYIIHTAFEIEYTRRKLAATDEVTAQVEGVKDDSSGSVTGTPDALIERPDHVFKWSILSLLNLDPSVIDTVSFSDAGTSFASAISGGYKLAGVVQEKKALGQLWQSWMKESRSYLFWDGQGKARLQFRQINNTQNLEGSEVKSLDASMVRLGADGKSRINLKRTSSQEIINQIDLKYFRNFGNLFSDDGFPFDNGYVYEKVFTVSDQVQGTVFGKREQPEAFQFDWCRLDTQAQDLADFYLAEFNQPHTLIDAEMFLDNLELERGDIIKFTHSLNNLSDVFALVLPGSHKLGSGKAGLMDSVNLRLRLFPIALIKDLLAEGVEILETLMTESIFYMTLAESAGASEDKFIQDNFLKSESADTAEIVFIFPKALFLESTEIAELTQVGDDPSLSDSTLEITEAALLSEAGWGIQDWGNSGWGGKELLL